MAYKWWQQWREYVDFDAPASEDVEPGRHTRRPSFFQQKQRPTAIDNSDLQCQHDQHLLRDGLQENYDYVLLPPAAHDMLHSWYPFNLQKNNFKIKAPFFFTLNFVDVYGICISYYANRVSVV